MEWFFSLDQGTQDFIAWVIAIAISLFLAYAHMEGH